MTLHEHKLVKRMSAVSFQETATVFDSKIPEILKDGTTNSNLNETKSSLKFRTILKKTMPKIQCISQFTALHENVQINNLEKNATLKVSDKTGESKLESANAKPIGNKKPLLRSKSLASSQFSINLSNLNSPKNELLQSFINPYQSKENLKTNKSKSRKSVKKKKQKRFFGNPVYIYSKDNQKHEMCNSEGAMECLKLQQYLEAKGVTVSLHTLKRALLPPSESRIELYEFNQTSLPNNSYSGLLNHPSTWMPKEYARLKSAKKIREQFEEEIIRQSIVVMSDDETSLSSSDERSRQTPNKSLQYNEFARKMSKSSISHFDLRGKRSVLLTKAKAVCKFKKPLRPKTAI